MERATKFWIAFVIGATLSFTNIVAPVHELGHLAMANKFNDEAQITSWNTTRVEIRLSHAYAGWWFEIWMFVLLGIFVLPATAWAGAAIGYAQLSWFRAFGSSDFNSYVTKVIEHYNLHGVTAQNIRSAVVNGWLWRGIILFVIVYVIVYFMIKKPVKPA